MATWQRPCNGTGFRDAVSRFEQLGYAPVDETKRDAILNALGGRIPAR